MAYQTTNPYTNEVVKTYENATPEYVEESLASTKVVQSVSE